MLAFNLQLLFRLVSTSLPTSTIRLYSVVMRWIKNQNSYFFGSNEGLWLVVVVVVSSSS